ncbi:MAG: winged helix-turn-helix domain-containing protein [Candidatus Bathyarchaeia archaeon]
MKKFRQSTRGEFIVDLSIRDCSKRRDKLQIIAEILGIARRNALKTQIMYRANLSFTQINDYLNFMLETHLLEKRTENGKDYYRATNNGVRYLQLYCALMDLLSSKDFKSEKLLESLPM